MSDKIWSMLKFPLKYPRETIKLFLDIFYSSHKVIPFYNLKYTLILFRTFRLLIRRGFVPNEAFRLGLLNLDFPHEKIDKFISKRYMERLQLSLNPLSWVELTENKGIFYQYCIAAGLPIPKLYAIFFRDVPGVNSNGIMLNSSKDWMEFINEELPSEFIIKPAGGLHGDGVMCFFRDDNKFFKDAASEKQYNAKDIYTFMSTYPSDNSFIIQERLKNHPELIRFGGTESLQTFRVLTFVDRKGVSHILIAYLKILIGQNIIANIDYGRTGNIVSEVNIETGTLKPAIRIILDSSEDQIVVSHPNTGIYFEKFSIPFWDELCRLSRDISNKFLPLRIIGWDIVITPEGPCILEGNFQADPPIYFKNMDTVLSKVYEDINQSS